MPDFHAIARWRVVWRFSDNRFTWSESLCLPHNDLYPTQTSAFREANELTGLRMNCNGPTNIRPRVTLQEMRVYDPEARIPYGSSKVNDDSALAEPIVEGVTSPDRPYSPFVVRVFSDTQVYSRPYWMSGIPDDAIGKQPFNFVSAKWLFAFQKWARRVCSLNLSGDLTLASPYNWGIWVEGRGDDNPTAGVAAIGPHPTDPSLTRIVTPLMGTGAGHQVVVIPGRWREGFVKLKGKLSVAAAAGGNVDVISTNYGAGYLGGAEIRTVTFGIAYCRGYSPLGNLCRIRGVRGIASPRGRRARR